MEYEYGIAVYGKVFRQNSREEAEYRMSRMVSSENIQLVRRPIGEWENVE